MLYIIHKRTSILELLWLCQQKLIFFHFTPRIRVQVFGMLQSKCALNIAIQSPMSLSQLTCTNLQSPEGVVLDTSDLVASKVKDPKVLQTPKHVGSDQVDEVAIESKLQQLCLVEKCPRLQG